MKRREFVQLTDVSEEAFNLLRARKLVPMRGQTKQKGWQDYSVEDAVALELAQALSRKGVRKADARDWVDFYFEIALGYVADETRPKNQPIFLGAAEFVQLLEGDVHYGGHERLVGTFADIADQLENFAAGYSATYVLEGYLVVNVDRCIRAVGQRAQLAGLDDPRLNQLVGCAQ